MAHEMTIRLTDDEYAILAEEAEFTGQELGELMQELLEEIVAKRARRAKKRRVTKKPDHPLSNREISELFYREGLTTHIPSGERLSPEDEAELKRIGDLLGQAGGKPASEMVIEDRGPY